MPERNRLHLPGGTIAAADRFRQLMRERQAALNLRNATPPTEIIKGINLSTVVIEKFDPVLIGTIEHTVRRGEPFKVPLYEIPDITIDLTPDSGDAPRTEIWFILSERSRRISVRAYFDTTHPSFWRKHEKELEDSVAAGLLQALSAEKWRLEWFNAWTPVTS